MSTTRTCSSLAFPRLPLIRRYFDALDANDSGDRSLIDEFVAEDFVAHNPPAPGVSLDREGLKQAAEIFSVATPGRHEIP